MNAKLIDLGDVAVVTKSNIVAPYVEEGEPCSANLRKTTSGTPQC